MAAASQRLVPWGRSAASGPTRRLSCLPEVLLSTSSTVDQKIFVSDAQRLSRQLMGAADAYNLLGVATTASGERRASLLGRRVALAFPPSAHGLSSAMGVWLSGAVAVPLPAPPLIWGDGAYCPPVSADGGAIAPPPNYRELWRRRLVESRAGLCVTFGRYAAALSEVCRDLGLPLLVFEAGALVTLREFEGRMQTSRFDRNARGSSNAGRAGPGHSHLLPSHPALHVFPHGGSEGLQCASVHTHGSLLSQFQRAPVTTSEVLVTAVGLDCLPGIMDFGLSRLFAGKRVWWPKADLLDTVRRALEHHAAQTRDVPIAQPLTLALDTDHAWAFLRADHLWDSSNLVQSQLAKVLLVGPDGHSASLGDPLGRKRALEVADRLRARLPETTVLQSVLWRPEVGSWLVGSRELQKAAGTNARRHPAHYRLTGQLLAGVVTSTAKPSGELRLASPGMCQGYFNRDLSQTKAFTKNGDELRMGVQAEVVDGTVELKDPLWKPHTFRRPTGSWRYDNKRDKMPRMPEGWAPKVPMWHHMWENYHAHPRLWRQKYGGSSN